MAEPDAAVAIVRAARPFDSVLLMRRTERETDSWSGHWSFPGGRCERADDDALAAALRELHEECGLSLGRRFMTDALPHSVARRRTGPFLLVAPFVFQVEEQMPLTPDVQETAEALWIPMQTLASAASHCLRRIPRMTADTLFPSVDLPGGPLWGFTYRILTDWLELAPKKPDAGFEAAYDVLRYLESLGLRTVEPWQPRGGRVAAQVGGAIPADAVLAHFGKVEEFRPAINRLQAQPERVRLAGPAFEEYLIEAAG